MKAIKYLVAGALMLSFTAPTMAQDVKSQVDAITKVVVDANGDVVATKNQVKEFLKQNKKDAEALAGLGRAFLSAKNFEQAKVYADMAIKTNKNNAAGYILHGDIASAEDNGGEAATWYEQSITFDPQNPVAYTKYARVYQKVDPDGAVAMLEKLRTVKPDYPVDAAAGYMYASNGQLKTAMSYYDKVADASTLDDYILMDYASTAYVLDDLDKALSLVSVGLKKYPQYTSFNRIGLYASDKQKKYDDAVSYAGKLFSTTDTIKYNVSDYVYYADALSNLGRYDDAIASYKKISSVDAENKDVNKYISNAYTKAKNFPAAVASYEQYLKDLGEDASYKDYDNFADIYLDQSEAAATPADKNEALRKAGEVYGQMADKFAHAASYALYKQANVYHAINPDLKVGEALPYYKKLIDVIEAQAEKKNSDISKLVTAYTYLAVHYVQNDKVAEAKQWAAKLLEIRPDDPNGQAIMNVK